MERKIEAGKIRHQALSALEKSTKLFEIAENLVRQGNESEAQWVRNEARAQRNISVWLMATANKPNAEKGAGSARSGDSYRRLDQSEHRSV